MDDSELDKFILKFKLLWGSGHNAHLDLERHAGQAWVGIRVQLGQDPELQTPKTCKNSPSRQRRRARRAAAKCAKDDHQAEEALADQQLDVTEAENASTKNSNKEKAVEALNVENEVEDEFCRNAEFIESVLDDVETSVTFAFNSEYGEQDIEEAIEEIFPDKTAVMSAKLLSRVRIAPTSGVHDCVLRLEVAAPKTFVWPKLQGVDVFVFKDIVKIR